MHALAFARANEPAEHATTTLVERLCDGHGQLTFATDAPVVGAGWCEEWEGSCDADSSAKTCATLTTTAAATATLHAPEAKISVHEERRVPLS